MGEVKVEITVDEFGITAVSVDVSNETRGSAVRRAKH
jgi:hypothetical protein